MSRDIFVRSLQGSPQQNPRIAKAVEWLARIREQSHLDTDVLTYPATCMLEAYIKGTGEPVLYMPIQHVYMMESLGPNPVASPVDIAKGLEEITKILSYDAHKSGIGEIYYPSTDPMVNAFAQRHHFSLMDYEAPCAVSEQNPSGMEKRLIPFFKMKVYK
jgi:hypothetical protein